MMINIKCTTVLHGRNIFIFVKCKSVYPYEYMDSWEKFEEAKLPPIVHFLTSWTWKVSVIKTLSMHIKFGIPWKKNLVCYHNTCLKIDVLVMAHVFETFQITCLNYVKLNPAHFYTVLGLWWKTLLDSLKIVWARDKA